MPEVYMPSIFLNSQQKGRGERTIEVTLDRGLFFPEAERIYLQVGQASIPYSFINISKNLYNNASFQTTPTIPPSTLTDFTLPEGCYLSLTELEAAFNNVLTAAGYDAAITISGDTVTNTVTITNSSGLGGAPQNIVLPDNLANELGFPPGTILPAQGISKTSTEPVLFQDIIASGILIVAEGDLQVTTFFQNVDNSNVLAQIPVQHTDVPGGMIIYPRDVIPINCPVVNLKSVRTFSIKFVSPRDPFRNLVFLQGDASLVLNFFAVY